MPSGFIQGRNFGRMTPYPRRSFGQRRLYSRPMRAKRHLVALALAVLPLAACQQLDPSIHRPDGPLTKAEIDSCLSNPHYVGQDLVSPKPEPNHVFRPGYNFSVKLKDGSYGFGYQESAEGRLMVKYPEHGTSIDYAVARKNGVVYIGDKPTNCT